MAHRDRAKERREGLLIGMKQSLSIVGNDAIDPEPALHP
jgi:hypothetical protein